MKCFLLVAGVGRRLRPLTERIPKCLLPISGKPLLQIWLEHLNRNSIDEVLVNTHWLHKKVEEFLENYKAIGLRVISFYEPILLGSAGTIIANKDWIDETEPFFIIYGDNLTRINLAKMLAYHLSHGLPFTLGVFRTGNPKSCGIADIRDDGVVIGFMEKPEQPESNLAAAGIYICDKRIFQFYPEKELLESQPLDLGFHVIPRLVGKMKAYLIEELFIDIGTPESYRQAQELWQESKL